MESRRPTPTPLDSAAEKLMARIPPGPGGPPLNLPGILDPPITPYAPPFPFSPGLARPEPAEDTLLTGNRSPPGG